MLFYTLLLLVSFFFFFNDTATTEIYTLSLHDALPISPGGHTAGAVVVGPRDADVLPQPVAGGVEVDRGRATPGAGVVGQDRKSTRLNSSHANISYAVFCLKKKNTNCSHENYLVMGYLS